MRNVPDILLLPLSDFFITGCTPGNLNPLLTCALRPGVQLTTSEARRFRRNAAAFTDTPVAPATQVNGVTISAL